MDQVVHLAPPASQGVRLMNDLLQWLEQSDEHPLITSSVFHYEFEFIHPFADGNGRVTLANLNPYKMESNFCQYSC